MNVTLGMTPCMRIVGAPKLDPITVYWEEFGAGRGRIAVVCWGRAWSAYWGAMGNYTVRQFFCHSHVDYIVSNMESSVPNVRASDTAYLTRIITAVQDAFRIADARPSLDDQAARALLIADEAMEELLRGHACLIDVNDQNLFGIVGADGSEVTTLTEADPAIAEAYEWLHQRGLAEIVKDATGECILLKGGAA